MSLGMDCLAPRDLSTRDMKQWDITWEHHGENMAGWWLGHPSEKYEFVNWDDEIPNINGKIKNGNQTTNQMVIFIHSVCMINHCNLNLINHCNISDKTCFYIHYHLTSNITFYINNICSFLSPLVIKEMFGFFKGMATLGIDGDIKPTWI